MLLRSVRVHRNALALRGRRLCRRHDGPCELRRLRQRVRHGRAVPRRSLRMCGRSGALRRLVRGPHGRRLELRRVRDGLRRWPGVRGRSVPVALPEPARPLRNRVCGSPFGRGPLRHLRHRVLVGRRVRRRNVPVRLRRGLDALWNVLRRHPERSASLRWLQHRVLGRSGLPSGSLRGARRCTGGPVLHERRPVHARLRRNVPLAR